MSETQHEREQRIRRQLWEVFGYIPPDARQRAETIPRADDNAPQRREVTGR